MHQDNYQGAAIACGILKAVRHRDGIDEAMQLAGDIITACASIIATERGPGAAIAVLELTESVLPINDVAAAVTLQADPSPPRGRGPRAAHRRAIGNR